jgi:hypothetical protein
MNNLDTKNIILMHILHKVYHDNPKIATVHYVKTLLSIYNYKLYID